VRATRRPSSSWPRSTPPANPSQAAAMQLSRAAWPFRQDPPVEALQALFEAGVRWEASPIEEIAGARRDLLKTDDWTFVRLMKLLATDDYCSREVLAELARTPSMRKAHGPGRADPAEPQATEQVRSKQPSEGQRGSGEVRGRAAAGEEGGRRSSASHSDRRVESEWALRPPRPSDTLRARLVCAGRQTRERVGSVRPGSVEGVQPSEGPRAAPRLLGESGGWSAGPPPKLPVLPPRLDLPQPGQQRVPTPAQLVHHPHLQTFIAWFHSLPAWLRGSRALGRRPAVLAQRPISSTSSALTSTRIPWRSRGVKWRRFSVATSRAPACRAISAMCAS